MACSFAVEDLHLLPKHQLAWRTHFMLPTSNPDRIHITFDDDRLVDHAGLLLPSTLAGRLGLRELADAHLDLDDAPGRRTPATSC